MDASLSVKEDTTPIKGRFILDGDAEVLSRQIKSSQKNKVLQKFINRQSDYDRILRNAFFYLADDFFSLNIDKIKKEAESRYNLTETWVYQKAKKRIFGYLSLFFGSAVGLCVYLGLPGLLGFTCLWFGFFLFWFMDAHPDSSRWFKCFQFLWSKFMFHRFSKKIEKLQSGNA